MVVKIAVCGGGISGLALALILKKFANPATFAVDIYEAGSAFKEIGAGITVWHRTRSILSALGLRAALKGRAVSPPFTLRKSDTKKPFAFHTLRIPHGSMTLPRVEIVNLLVEALKAGSTPWLKVHFSKELKGYEQDGAGVLLHFADDSASRADILIGADGIGSPTRKAMYSDLASHVARHYPEKAAQILQAAQPKWTGSYVYRMMIDVEKLRAVSPRNAMLTGGFMWCGDGAHAVSYPISSKWVNAGVFDTIPGGLENPLPRPSVRSVSKEDIPELYKDWEDDICVALENAEEVSKWAISHVRGLPQYVDGRVALIGDSAHAMSTHFGAGPGQAIDDSYILGRILSHPLVTPDNVVTALQVYDAIRRPIASDAIERSLRVGFLYEFHPDYLPPGTDIERLRGGDRMELQKVGNTLQDIWRFHWERMPDQDWDCAERMLAEKLCGLLPE